MDFMALFTMATGGHYITMLPADWSISKMLWNPSIHETIGAG